MPDGNISGGQDDDVGRAYLDTQQAMAQIRGKNRPILVLLLPFFCIRQLPSDSVSFRRHPSASVAGRFRSVCLMTTCLGARVVMSGEHIWKPNTHWVKFAGEIDLF